MEIFNEEVGGVLSAMYQYLVADEFTSIDDAGGDF